MIMTEREWEAGEQQNEEEARSSMQNGGECTPSAASMPIPSAAGSPAGAGRAGECKAGRETHVLPSVSGSGDALLPHARNARAPTPPRRPMAGMRRAIYWEEVLKITAWRRPSL